jgi:uncharacterized membrane protein
MYKNIVASLILLLLDGAWISLYMGDKYKILVQKIQKQKLNSKPEFVVLAYLSLLIALNVFVLPNIRKGKELEDSLKYGFLFGAILYAVYDFTCASLFKDWNISLAVIDILWGGFIFFVASYVSSKYIKN